MDEWVKTYCLTWTINSEKSNATAFNDVKIVDKTYLEHSFKASEGQQFIDNTATEFCLNEEQERTYQIVANYATTKNTDRLKMYIGGMGGTGKTQVIKALIKFFEKETNHITF